MRYLFLGALLFFIHTSFAGTTNLNSEPHYKITKEAKYFFDENNLNAQQALQLKDWKIIKTDRINFGFISNPVWVKFNIASDTNNNWVLHIDYPLLDYLDIHIIENNNIIQSYQTGDSRDFDSRPLDHYNFTFPINIKKDQPVTVLMRVETKGAAELPIYLQKPASFNSNTKKAEFIRGIINGILAIMLIYNLFIFLYIKEKLYIFYVANVAVLLVQFSLFDGSGFQFLWPNYPEFNARIFPLFNGLLQLTQFLFLVVYLDIFNRNSWYVKPSKILASILFSLPILGLIIDYHIIVPIQVVFAITVNITGLLFGLYFSFKGEASAKYFTLAWAVFLIGLLITNFKSLGLLPTNMFTIYSYQIGAFIEMTVLSLALAKRMETAKRNLIKLQNENILALENYQNLYNNSLSGQFQSTMKGELVSTNPAFLRMFDPSGKWQNQNDLHSVVELVENPKDLKKIESLITNNGALIDFEIQLKNNDGEIHWYSLSVRPHKTLDSGTIFDGSILDINERKEHEELKEQALQERMSSLEHLSIGICHELNTPLGITITGTSHLEGLISELSNLIDDEKLTKQQLLSILGQENESMNLIGSNLKRMNELIKRFKQVSVTQMGFAVNEQKVLTSIKQSLDTLDKQLAGIEVNIDCDSDISLHSYNKALEMVFKELMENSIIHSFNEQPQGAIHIIVEQEQHELIIHYKDNGQGINQEKYNELFNAFYTTKRGSHGHIGLGLYLVFNLVNQLLRGTIELQKSAHVHFVIRIPLNADDSTPLKL